MRVWVGTRRWREPTDRGRVLSGLEPRDGGFAPGVRPSIWRYHQQGHPRPSCDLGMMRTCGLAWSIATIAALPPSKSVDTLIWASAGHAKNVKRATVGRRGRMDFRKRQGDRWGKPRMELIQGIDAGTSRGKEREVSWIGRWSGKPEGVRG
jgi:hypothetical protein